MQFCFDEPPTQPLSVFYQRQKKQESGCKYWAVRSHHPLIRSLRCAHSLARSLTPELLGKAIQFWDIRLFWTIERESHWSKTAKNRLQYWATRSSVRLFARTANSHCSLVRLLQTACFARALRCAHLFARSLTLLTPLLVGTWILDVSKWPGFVP